MLRAARAAAALLLLAAPARAELYPAAELAEARAAYADNIRYQLREDMGVPAHAIALSLPDRGPNPLSVWAEPASASVSLPIATVRFIDDLGILWTHLDRHGCERNYILTYLHALLREGRALPGPLAAFGIPRETALADPFVNDVSGKIVTTAIYFLLAHEVAHLALGHAARGPGAASIAQEVEADAVALAAFREKGLPPIGVSFYFLAARWLDPARADALGSTHPLSADRIAALAEAMLNDPAAYSHAEPDPQAGAARVTSMATDLLRVARRAAEDGVIAALPAGLAEAHPLDRLARACD